MNQTFQSVRRFRGVGVALATATLLAGCGAPTIAETPGVVSAAAGTPVKPAEKAAPKTPEVGDMAPDFALMNLRDKKIRLSALTKKGPVVLIVLRGYPGYQCPLCTAQFAQLRAHAAEFAKAKARVLLIYPGPSDELKKRADEFVKGEALPANFEFVIDPNYAVVNLYGLRWDAPNETAYPSTFVLNGARQVLFAKVSKGHGDRSTPAQILAALPKNPQ